MQYIVQSNCAPLYARFCNLAKQVEKTQRPCTRTSSSFSAHLGNLVCHIGFSISAFRGEFVDILSYPVPAECSWHFLTRILPASFSDLSPGVKLSIEFVWSSNNSDNEEKGKNGQLDSPQSLYYSFLRNQPIMSQPSWIGSRWLCVSKRFSAVSISYCWVK